MTMTKEQRARISAQVEALQKRLAIDSGDLDYETHLHAIRTLQGIFGKDTERKMRKK